MWKLSSLCLEVLLKIYLTPNYIDGSPTTTIVLTSLEELSIIVATKVGPGDGHSLRILPLEMLSTQKHAASRRREDEIEWRGKGAPEVLKKTEQFIQQFTWVKTHLGGATMPRTEIVAADRYQSEDDITTMIQALDEKSIWKDKARNIMAIRDIYIDEAGLIRCQPRQTWMGVLKDTYKLRHLVSEFPCHDEGSKYGSWCKGLWRNLTQRIRTGELVVPSYFPPLPLDELDEDSPEPDI